MSAMFSMIVLRMKACPQHSTGKEGVTISLVLINIASHLTACGFAVLLCYLWRPEFLPDKSISPHDGVVSRLAAHLKLQYDFWAEYTSREVTRWEHLAELYRCPEWSPFNWGQQKNCIRHLYPHAMRIDRFFYSRRKCSPGSTIVRLFFPLLRWLNEP